MLGEAEACDRRGPQRCSLLRDSVRSDDGVVVAQACYVLQLVAARRPALAAGAQGPAPSASYRRQIVHMERMLEGLAGVIEFDTEAKHGAKIKSLELTIKRAREDGHSKKAIDAADALEKLKLKPPRLPHALAVRLEAAKTLTALCDADSDAGDALGRDGAEWHGCDKPNMSTNTIERMLVGHVDPELLEPLAQVAGRFFARETAHEEILAKRAEEDANFGKKLEELHKAEGDSVRHKFAESDVVRTWLDHVADRINLLDSGRQGRNFAEPFDNLKELKEEIERRRKIEATGKAT